MTKEPEETPDKSEYEVGYAKPPKSGQFKPGESGNPKGRKRKPKSVQSQMRTILTKRITINEGGQAKRLTLQEVMLRNIANKAVRGDLKAANFVLALINSDAAAQTETIDQVELSSEDQARYEQMLRELTYEESASHAGPYDDPTRQSQNKETATPEVPNNDT